MAIVKKYLPPIDLDIRDCPRQSLDVVLKSCVKLSTIRFQSSTDGSLSAPIHIQVLGEKDRNVPRRYCISYSLGRLQKGTEHAYLSQQRVNALRPDSIVRTR